MARYQQNANETRRRKRVKDKKIIIYTRKNGEYYPLHPGQLWAYVRQLSGDEMYKAKQSFREEDIQFVVNYRADYSDWDHIGYRGKFYNITRVDTYEGYKTDLTIYANSVRGGQPDASEVHEWNE